MSFSQFAGTAIMPLLARVVLVAAFLPAGYHKIFDMRQFESGDAAVLTELGVGRSVDVTADAGSPVIGLAAFQDEPAIDAGDDAPPAEAEGEGDEVAPASEDEPVAADAAETPLVSPPADDVVPVGTVSPVSARSMHGVTVMLVEGGWKKQWRPEYMAWVASLTEFLGGALILLGLFSRVWGLGLAIAMGFAFYLTTLSALVDPGLFQLGRGMGAGDAFDGYRTHNAMFCQLSLLLLALGVFLAGPGPVSLDRMLFRRGGRVGAGDDGDVV